MKKWLFIMMLLVSFGSHAQERTIFQTPDSLVITADLYAPNPETSPFIILFHQAGWSRGEYLEIAPKLNAMGYNCLAVDQRAGGSVNSVLNESHKRAKEQGLKFAFIDAETDMLTAIDYVKNKFSKAEKLIIWGSSYSASLVLKIAAEQPEIDGVLAFAPGEYFTRYGNDKPDDFIESSVKTLNIPVFITSKKSEKSNWWSVYKAIPSTQKTYFLPESGGQHGSRALWQKFPQHEAYWQAVTDFLKTI